jgi:UDP-glucuronate decarboxylase
MKFLVTGGAGFLGSYLCENLLTLNHEVICLDNLSTGNLENIKHLTANKKFQFLQHDVTTPVQIKIDGVFNLACPASPVQYQKNPVDTFKTNVLGTLNMLELAKQNQARFLQASTSEIYGDPEVTPQSEEYWGNVNPIGLRSCYDEGKRAAETLIKDYQRQFNLDTRIARIFNTFGPRMAVDDGRVVSNFIVQALRNEPLTIYGNGNQTRSFCYVSDLIEGLIKLFFSEGFYEPINLGNPDPTSMKALANEIIKLVESKSEISYLQLPSDDPKNRKPSIEKAKQFLKWEPKISRETGLLQTIKFFHTKLNNITNS